MIRMLLKHLDTKQTPQISQSPVKLSESHIFGSNYVGSTSSWQVVRAGPSSPPPLLHPLPSRLRQPPPTAACDIDAGGRRATPPALAARLAITNSSIWQSAYRQQTIRCEGNAQPDNLTGTRILAKTSSEHPKHVKSNGSVHAASSELWALGRTAGISGPTCSIT